MLHPALLAELSSLAADTDRSGLWPQRQWETLAECGFLERTLSARQDDDAAQAELQADYIELAAACLATAFVLTQFHGAAYRLQRSANAELWCEWMPQLANGTAFASLGISHLTTSGQHLRKPAVIVREVSANELVLDGTIPWVTGASQAQVIVTGGTFADGQQTLIALRTHLPGVRVLPAEQLLALQGSFTASVELREVRVSRADLLA